MDKAAINTALARFTESCKIKGYPVADICLEEAYPGVEDTSYLVHLKADWMGDMSCSEALDIIIPIFFDTVELQYRKKVFAFKLTDSDEKFRCLEPVPTGVRGTPVMK